MQQTQQPFLEKCLSLVRGGATFRIARRHHVTFVPIGCNLRIPHSYQSMFEQTFKNIDDILHKDAGCTSELDYTEQSSWLLFLKYLDALEADKATEAA